MSHTTARNTVLFPGLVMALLALFAASLVLAPQQARAFEPDAKVVYHADFADPRRFSAMITSINNMVTHYENEFMEADVRIVFVSHGIRFLTEDNLEDTPFEADEELLEERDRLQSRLRNLANTYGVKLELCDIPRSEIGLDEDELMDDVDIDLVPSGVVRIAELQNDEGFAYLKIE